MLCAFGMVSSLPYVHFMNRYVRGARTFGYVARLVIPLFLRVWGFQEVLALAFTWYAVQTPARYGWGWLRRRGRTSDDPTVEPP